MELATDLRRAVVLSTLLQIVLVLVDKHA